MQSKQQGTSTTEGESGTDSESRSLIGRNRSRLIPVSGETDEGLPLDDIFEILRNGRRRHVLRHLHEHDGDVTIGDLADVIAAEENDTTPEQLSSDERKRVYVGLYQCHLPKMDDADVIDYNQSRGEVTLAEQSDYFTRYLADVNEPLRIRWYLPYAGVAALGLLLFSVAAMLGFPGQVVTISLGGIVGLIAACTAFHWYAVS